MKPHERGGVVLEDLGEIGTAATVLEFLGGLAEFSPDGRVATNGLAGVMRDMQRAYENVALLQDNDSRNPGAVLELTNAFDATVLTGALDVAVKVHPDELVRQAAQDMILSYQQAVFEKGMGPPPGG